MKLQSQKADQREKIIECKLLMKIKKMKWTKVQNMNKTIERNENDFS